MKHYFFILATVLITQIGFAQTPHPPVEPKFMNAGNARFYKFITDEIDFSKVASEKTMWVTFYLDKSGMMNNIKAIEFKNQAAATEVIRVLKKAKKWDVSNQTKSFTAIRYKIKLIFSNKKVLGQTQVMWDAKPDSSIPAEIKEDPNKVFSAMELESKPEFPGGAQLFYSFVSKNYIIPDDEKFKGGKVFANFVVEKDGSVTEIKILKDCGFGTGEELKRILLLCPKWKPAMQNNQPVRCMYTIPVTLTPNN